MRLRRVLAATLAAAVLSTAGATGAAAGSVGVKTSVRIDHGCAAAWRGNGLALACLRRDGFVAVASNLRSDATLVFVFEAGLRVVIPPGERRALANAAGPARAFLRGRATVQGRPLAASDFSLEMARRAD